MFHIKWLPLKGQHKALSRKCTILQPFNSNLLLFTVKFVEEALSSVFVGDICNKTIIKKIKKDLITFWTFCVLSWVTAVYLQMSTYTLLAWGCEHLALSTTMSKYSLTQPVESLSLSRFCYPPLCLVSNQSNSKISVTQCASVSSERWLHHTQHALCMQGPTVYMFEFERHKSSARISLL